MRILRVHIKMYSVSDCKCCTEVGGCIVVTDDGLIFREKCGPVAARVDI